MKFTATVLAIASAAAMVDAHGYFVTPKARQPGTAFAAACSEQAYYNMMGSINGNIQGLLQVATSQPDYNPQQCHMWMCKGMKYADNKDNVHKYTPGQSIPMYFDIVAPHTGTANVSIVKTSTNKILAANLKQWTNYASTSTSIPDGQEHFNVKMPTNLGTKCANAGDCVIQMHWNAASVDQTYQSCIDFTLSGASSKRDAENESRLHMRDFSPRNADEE